MTAMSRNNSINRVSKSRSIPHPNKNAFLFSLSALSRNMDEIAPLVSKAAFWDWIDGWSLIFVIVGVVGEGLHEWPPSIVRNWQWFHNLGRLSWLILLAGLAGEFIAQNNRNADNNLIVAALNDRAAQAEKLAAKLMTDLDAERRNVCRVLSPTRNCQH